MNAVQIIPACPADIEDLADFLYILFTQESDFQPDRNKQTDGLRKIITDASKGFILVAKSEDEIIGMVSVLILISTAEGGEVGILEDMIVQPAYHGKGVGSLLLEQAKHKAKELGLSRITLLTDAANDKGIRFYKRHEFSESAMIAMRIQL